MSKNIIKAIELIIDQKIAKNSEKHKIAFYALTSKSEHNYRDEIAFNLYKKFNNEYNVIREWKKCDLAIIKKNSGEPVALVEFKVCYSCDLYKKSTIKEYVDSIKNDFKKSKKLANKNTEIYSILFIVKPKERIPDELEQVVKYRKSINTGFNVNGDAKNLENIGEMNLKSKFDNIVFKELFIDEAFDIKCGLGYCIIKSEF